MTKVWIPATYTIQWIHFAHIIKFTVSCMIADFSIATIQSFFLLNESQTDLFVFIFSL